MEQEYVFDDENAKKNKSSGGIGKFIWNSRTKEFLGRDGASWGKVSLFYAIFYACLGSFFVGMLAVFFQIMPKDRPTYYGESSTMNQRGLNPGLGFRPQIDVEDTLISFNPANVEGKNGYRQYVQNVQNFLNAKYPDVPSEYANNVIECKENSTYVDKLKDGYACKFDYKTLFEDTKCTAKDSYGFDTNKPCVLIKLNKIIDLLPTESVKVRCDGESSVDKDNLKSVVYHSANHLEDAKEGVLDISYFPFFAQKAYRAPFIWVQFDIPANTLVNIECKAYASNIDNADRLNRRGQTKLSLYISSK